MGGWFVRLLIYHSDKRDEYRGERQHFGGNKRMTWCLSTTFGGFPVDYITALFRSLLTLGQLPGKNVVIYESHRSDTLQSLSPGSGADLEPQ